MAAADIDSTASMLGGSSTSYKHDVPAENLDYTYIGKCTNVKELEKILKVLRSGKEGYFPNLERFTEDQIRTLNPSSRILRKEERISTAADVEGEEWKTITSGLEDWTTEMKNAENKLKESETKTSDLPPVRTTNTTEFSSSKENQKSKTTNPNKRVTPRDYREWDKIDIEEELKKVEEKTGEEKTTKPKKSTKPDIAEKVDTTGLTDKEKELLAVREKDKGNEAFRAGDYSEALVYYNRSLSVIPSANSYNNRALTYVKLEMWDSAINDLNKVLSQEPDNIKAFLRRGVSYKGKKEYMKAKKDLQQALALEPTNKRAKDLLSEVSKLIAKEEQEKKERKEKGRRMLIEEVEGSEDEDESPQQQTEEEDSLRLPDSGSGKRVIIEEVESSDSQNVLENDTDAAEAQNNLENLTNSKAADSSEAEKDVQQNNTADAVANSADEKGHDSMSEGQTKVTADDVAPSGVDNSSSLDSDRLSSPENEVADNTVTSKTDTDVTVSDSGSKKEDKTEADSAVKNALSTNAETALQTQTETPAETDGIVVVSEESKDDDKVQVKELPPPPPLPATIAQLKELGNTMFRNGQYAEAISHYSHAIDQLLDDKSNHPFHMSTLYSNRAACKSKIGDCRGCVYDCNFALELIPHSFKPLLRRAAAYEIMEKYKEAYVDYKHALAIDSSVEMAHQGSTRCQSMLQQIHGPKWRQNLPNIPSPGSANVARGPVTTLASTSDSPLTSTTSSTSDARVASNTSEDACKSSSSATSIMQQELSTQEKFEKLKQEGNTLVQKGEFEAAAEQYTGCIALCPDNVVGYTNRALCYIRLNKAQHAETDTSQALNLDPDNIKALFRRAQARKMLSQYKESLADLTKLLKTDPKNSAAKREVELVKNYYREQLNAKKADMPSSDKSTQSNTQKSGKSKPKIETLESKPASSDHSQQKRPAHSQKKKQRSEKSDPLPKVSPTTPHLSKATPYEFMQAWNSLKQVKEIKPYAELVAQVQPQDLPKVLSNKLDDHMLTTILKCIETRFIEKGEADKAYEYLENLTRVPRFQMVALFMSDSDKSYLKDILEKLGNCGLSNRDTQRLQMLYNM